VAGTEPTRFDTYDGAQLTQQQGNATLMLGFTASPLYTQGAMFEVISQIRPTSVMSGDTALTERASLLLLEGASDGWFWEAATGGTLWIKVPGTATISVTPSL
jgi:hypothetical protein